MQSRTKQAQRITLIGFFGNFMLSTFKLIAGIAGNSAAMVADAVHSISDFITDVIVIAFVKVADKAGDEDHKYGHGKFETFATLVISVALLLAGGGILLSGFRTIMASLSGIEIGKPSYIALIAAVASILIKEILYRYTVKVGRDINNNAVIANAWHHRSDAFSSIGTALGITGAMFLGDQWRILDPLAGVIVSFFIIRIAVILGIPSIKELLEGALPAETEKEILNIIHQTPGVIDSHRLKTRKIGNIYAIDIHIKLDPQLTLTQSHDIATEVEQRLFNKYGRGTHINIHMEPYRRGGVEL